MSGKTLHRIGPILIGWILVMPPHHEVMLGSVVFDAKAPIPKWIQKSSCETQKACEESRRSSERLSCLDAPDRTWCDLYAASRCVDLDNARADGRSE